MSLVNFSGKNATATLTPQTVTGNATTLTYAPGNASEFNIKNWRAQGTTEEVTFKGSQTGDIPAIEDTYKTWTISGQIGFNFAAGSSPFALGNFSGNMANTVTGGGGNLTTGITQSVYPGALLGNFTGFLHQSQRGALDGKTFSASSLKIKTVDFALDPENPKDILVNFTGSAQGTVILPV